MSKVIFAFHLFLKAALQHVNAKKKKVSPSLLPAPSNVTTTLDLLR